MPKDQNQTSAETDAEWLTRHFEGFGYPVVILSPGEVQLPPAAAATPEGRPGRTNPEVRARQVMKNLAANAPRT
jgi:hypothetical protein